MSQILNPIICPRCYAYKDGNTMPICICKPISVDPQEELREETEFDRLKKQKDDILKGERRRVIEQIRAEERLRFDTLLAEREQAVREKFRLIPNNMAEFELSVKNTLKDLQVSHPEIAINHNSARSLCKRFLGNYLALKQ